MLLTYFLFGIGLIFIIKGGDHFVDEATWVARVTGLPEVLIGATIVSLGTTFPETSVSVISSMQNRPTVAIGNAIGSIICNIGLVLAMYNVIKPSRIDSRIFKLKGMMMIGYIVFFWWSAQKGYIGLSSAVGLLMLLLVYIIFNVTIVQYKNKTKHTKRQIKRQTKRKTVPKGISKHVAMFILGIILILMGSNFLVTYGVKIANSWGVPEAVISLSMIALGTSLPELVTSMTALIKGHDELSIGNILGANILNICLVLGASASVSPLTIERQTIVLDIPVAMILSLGLVIPTIVTRRISRIQASLLLMVYVIYMVILFFFL